MMEKKMVWTNAPDLLHFSKRWFIASYSWESTVFIFKILTMCYIYLFIYF
jgi:hypothetical protein